MTAPNPRPAQMAGLVAAVVGAASQDADGRLIPEADLRDAIVPGYWTHIHSDAEVLEIAEIRLLLGLPTDTDIVSGGMLLRLVRRVVLLERQHATSGTALDVPGIPGGPSGPTRSGEALSGDPGGGGQ